MKRIQNPTVSKGYRLKASTHKMIRKVQEILSCTQEGVIGRAVQMYYTEVRKAELKQDINLYSHEESNII